MGIFGLNAQDYKRRAVNVDVIHAREVLKNLLLYGFNRK